MKILRSLTLALLATALVPAGAHAQFFGGYGGYGGFGGLGSYGYAGYSPFGSYGTYGGGFGGYGLGGYSGYVTGPSFFTTSAYIMPITYTVSSPPRERDSLSPAIPYRDTLGEGSQAHIKVRVPSDSAEVSFDGVAMKQGGIDRHYVTPPLELGIAYKIAIRVRWRDKTGKEMTRTKEVPVYAGGAQSVDFLTAP